MLHFIITVATADKIIMRCFSDGLYSGCQKNVPLYNQFFYNHLYRNSLFWNIFMESGIKMVLYIHVKKKIIK